MFKGPMDKAKGEKDLGWDVGGGVRPGKVIVGKWRQLCLNNNLKKER